MTLAFPHQEKCQSCLRIWWLCLDLGTCYQHLSLPCLFLVMFCSLQFSFTVKKKSRFLQIPSFIGLTAQSIFPLLLLLTYYISFWGRSYFLQQYYLSLYSTISIFVKPAKQYLNFLYNFRMNYQCCADLPNALVLIVGSMEVNCSIWRMKTH